MKRTKAICAGVPAGLRPFVVELAENVDAMRRKLAEDRCAIASEPLEVEYDNGGGQSGYRRNPAIESYNQLMANYRKSLELLIGILADHPPDDGTVGESPLAQILREAEKVIEDARA